MSTVYCNVQVAELFYAILLYVFKLFIYFIFKNVFAKRPLTECPGIYRTIGERIIKHKTYIVMRFIHVNYE